jgi:hypothetical protein
MSILHIATYYVAMHKDKKLKSQRTLITQQFFSFDDDIFSPPQFLGFESLTNFPKF